MMREQFRLDYDVYDSSAALTERDRQLFETARTATDHAYAPYSKFRVGAAVKLANGRMITGSNQENASFPAGLCAEGVAMAAAASRFPNVAIEAIAVTYRSENRPADHPISPCGICRQTMQEYQSRSGLPIRLIMGGEGKIIIVDDASALLPFAFTF